MATDRDAYALLALNSAPGSPTASQTDVNLDLLKQPQSCSLPLTWASPIVTPIARLRGKDIDYLMVKNRIIVGRNSSSGDVDVNMGHSSFISREHVEICFELNNDNHYEGSQFFLTCGGKNGVFVDGVFQQKSAPRLLMPKA